jgi:ABC-type transport system involved in cytochrome bd biosynthesis fused ATPase/permease subunit
MAGLAPLAQGRVLLNDVDLGDIAPDDRMAHLAWVPQDPALIGTTIREAVACGRPLRDDALSNALSLVALPLDLDTVLHDASLSAGQRRRLALARAIAGEPDVVFLDEPLAHLDADTARDIDLLITTLPMTRVVATHRPLSTGRVIELVLS